MRVSIYRNYEIYDENHDIIGEELCAWCLKELMDLGAIEVDPKEPYFTIDR